MRKRTRSELSVLLSIAIVFFSIECNSNINNSISEDPLENDSLSLFLAVDGDVTGIWQLSLNSLQVRDSLVTTPGVPFDMILSSDKKVIFSAWGRGPKQNLYAIDINSLLIKYSTSLLPGNSFILAGSEQERIINYGNSGIETFDPPSLTSVSIDTSISQIGVMISYFEKSMLAFAKTGTRKPAVIYLYNLSKMSINDSILIANGNLLEIADIEISKDGRWLFVSAFNWISGGGFNSFFVIDLDTKEILREYDCGAFAQLALSNDDFVYISDPAGFLYQMIPINQILRYNMNSQNMEIFVEASDLPLDFTVFTSTYMALSQDGRILSVAVNGDIHDKKAKRIELLNFDTETKRMLNSFSFRVDSLGRSRKLIKQVIFFN